MAVARYRMICLVLSISLKDPSVSINASSVAKCTFSLTNFAITLWEVKGNKEIYLPKMKKKVSSNIVHRKQSYKCIQYVLNQGLNLCPIISNFSKIVKRKIHHDWVLQVKYFPRITVLCVMFASQSAVLRPGGDGSIIWRWVSRSHHYISEIIFP